MLCEEAVENGLESAQGGSVTTDGILSYCHLPPPGVRPGQVEKEYKVPHTICLTRAFF